MGPPYWLTERKSMTSKVTSALLIRSTGTLAIVLLSSPVAFAECASDLHGEVYCGGGCCIRDRKGIVGCARSYEGGAQTTRDESVLCGKGECAKSSRGQILCSSELGGAVLKDTRGRVRCYGRCERASAEQCVHIRAGGAELHLLIQRSFRFPALVSTSNNEWSERKPSRGSG